ncbi:MAG: hypothetical protein A3B37_01600 [Candidatus Sungbacteria bacterium RIFCSPLOWO2_01_FULL_59_16]|uniref:LamG-like jellyroll fold domain-containing protein n=1 Tax=Candidatus Sungbacteria bacterium RIFCSPLOWO2_01_FULL_59_16 TaxID=1802280 RepID=A0A1G2L9Z6_9BACT|nr:MAG: hypothetical protein A3B37_01600 [Candidatus Sungbacteria bacterium RIFCSPLOWO2_01_FULL_59_16]
MKTRITNGFRNKSERTFVFIRYHIRSLFLFPRSGVTLLIVVVLAGAILSIGIGVFELAFGELLISGEAVDSFRAIMAADRGLEKLLYLDRVLDWDGSPAGCPGAGACTFEPDGTFPLGGDLCLALKLTREAGTANTTATSVGEVRCGNPIAGGKRALRVSYQKENPLVAGLVGYWAFNDAAVNPTSQTAADSSGNGNDGTLGSTAGGDVNDPEWTNLGGPNYALKFDGVDEYVSCGTSGFPAGSAARTVSAWFNVDSYPTARPTIAGYGNDAINSFGDFKLAVKNTGAVMVRYNGADTESAGGLITTSAWHHLVATYDGSIVELFLDGNEDPVASVARPLNTAATSCTIGRFTPTAGDTNYFDGCIEDVKVWNSVFDSAEISNEFSSYTPPASCEL